MTKRKRISLIAVLAALFLTAAPLAIFYSLGWRFDWQKKEITKPGIFYFKTRPNSAQVFINGEAEDKTDFFFGSVVIENLLPKEYQVEIKKKNYHSWKKNLEIKRGEVTEAKNIVLVPKDPKLEKISGNIEAFYSKNGEIILEEKGWSLKLYNPESGVKSHLAKKEDFSKKPSQVVDISFSPESFLIKLFEEESFQYYLLKKEEDRIISLDFLPSPEKVFFNPKDRNKLFIVKEGELKEADISGEKISKALLKEIVSLEIGENNLFYLNSEGFAFQNDFSLQEERKLNQKAFPLKKETEYSLKASPPYLFLKEREALYYLKEDSFEKISEKAGGFRLSPDKKKLAYFNNGEPWIYFLEDTESLPKRKKGDNIFITRLSENIKDLFWYTNHYLIFSTEKNIRVAETDNRDRINVVTLTEFKDPQILWQNQKLYLLSESSFYRAESLIP